MADRQATALIHPPPPALDGFVAPQSGVFFASTVIFPSLAEMRARERASVQPDWPHPGGHTYGLHGTPTTDLLEQRLCALEGGSRALLLPSGQAAIAHVNLSLLRAGDEVLIPDNAYGPGKSLARAELARWGIGHQIYDPMDPADLARRLGPKTRLVWLEAAGSVTLEFPDLPALVRLCRKHGVLSALDNTWGAGLAFAPFELEPGLGVDLTVHALTKYPSGGADVLMGSIQCRDAALHHSLEQSRRRLGWGVSAAESGLLLRSLASVELRYRAQDQAARRLAHWCGQQPAVRQVLHPAVAGSPGHAHWQQLCGSKDLAAGLFTLVLDPRYSQQQVDAFCEALRLFRLGYSWGGPMSLVMPYELTTMRTTWPPGVQPGYLVRLAVGLESVDDLLADLAQAFERCLPPL